MQLCLAFQTVQVQRFRGQQKNMSDVCLIPGLRVPLPPASPKLDLAVLTTAKGPIIGLWKHMTD